VEVIGAPDFFRRRVIDVLGAAVAAAIVTASSDHGAPQSTPRPDRASYRQLVIANSAVVGN
jgi:hypothetical protein